MIRIAPLLLLLVGCQQLAIPIDLQRSLGEYREGAQTFYLPASIKSIALRIDPRTIDFGRPPVPLTHAEGSAKVTFTLLNQHKEPIQGKARFKLYIAPAGMEPWSNDFLLVSREITLSPNQSIEMATTLNRIQLQAVNQGRATIGIEVDLETNAYSNQVTLYWKFERLLIGVGII